MLAALAGTLLSGSSAAKDASAPNWMHVLSSLPLPPHDEKTDAVILYSEIILVVEPNGKIKETRAGLRTRSFAQAEDTLPNNILFSTTKVVSRIFMDGVSLRREAIMK